jgi:hypothetical protein
MESVIKINFYELTSQTGCRIFEQARLGAYPKIVNMIVATT